MSAPEVPASLHPASLCHACAARRYVRGAASWFILCTALSNKYPPQPVRACVAFTPREEASD